jgi:CRP-like cAMP-binding protein
VLKIGDLPELHSVLAKDEWFAGLPEAVQDRMIAEGRTRRFRRGEAVAPAGAAVSGLHALVRGQLRCCAPSNTGRTVLLGVHHPSAWFGYLSCFDGKPNAFDFVASTDSTIHTVPLPVIRDLINSDGRLAAYFLEPQVRLTRRIFDYLVNSIRLSPLQRLAERLIFLSRSAFCDSGEIHPIIGLSQELLATTILCTRQTTNELLSELSVRGMIRSEYGRIEILKPEALRALVDH